MPEEKYSQTIKLNHNLKKPINLSFKGSVFIVVILLLLGISSYFGFKYYSVSQELARAKQSIKSQQLNEKVLNFAKLFIEKVLKTKTEIDFETRLKLENAVRNLNDEEVLERWNNFVNSKTESEAQDNVKNLLETLITKIKPQ